MNLKNILGEKTKGADGKACWKGYKYAGTDEDGKDKCVKESETVLFRSEALRLEIIEHNEPVIFQEAEYQGRKVALNKPMQGDQKKFKVYVKDPSTGNIKVVHFGQGGEAAKKPGQETQRIRKDNPKARKSFRARHNCDNPGPKTKARYWSCKAW